MLNSLPSKQPLAALALACFLCCPFSTLRAQQQSALPSFSSNPASIDRIRARSEQAEREALSNEIKQFTDPLPGIELHAGYIAEFLANVSGGPKKGSAYDGLAKFSIKIDPGQLFHQADWTGTTLFANLLYPHGRGLTQHYLQDFNGVSNIDAYDSFRLDEFWLQQAFGSRFSIRAGLLAVDTEFFACDSGSLFFNSCFGAIPIISLNYDSPVYPLTSPGVRVEYDVSDTLTLRAAALSGDIGGQDTNNRHGGRISFHSETGGLYLAEAVVHTGGKLPGVYTLGGFYHSGQFDDVSGNGSRHRNDGGVYLVIDKALFRESQPVSDKKAVSGPEQGLNIFSRFGYAFPDDRNIVSYYVEAGLTYHGLIKNRDSDTCGIAFSYTRLSDSLTDEDGAKVSSHHETVVEGSYQFVVNDWVSVQPDIQYIFNPGATGNTRDAWVIGARVNFNF
ncbi:MAG TPA: carbohydrate porin [Chthoniobacter sp.]|nr:carbohydrate porin [Chthoniobacter sp.]